MSVKEKTTIEKAVTPESVGVSSKTVQAFVDRSMQLGKELHSICVIRHGKIAVEAYREPYGPQYKHMMYSVSKSFTSIAIGFAVEEGYFTVDTKFVDIFPEAKTKKSDPLLEKMTVEDLLTMRSGLSVTPFMDKTKDNWFNDILASKFVDAPGTNFRYISENMYLLCCIIHKKTGQSVVDYLKPRLFEPLDIEDVFWETDPRGIEAGGWGLMLSTRDLAKFTLCMQQKGKFGGKQIIPEKWIERATSKISDNLEYSEGEIDAGAGYGYCFWRNGGYKNSYRADGMFCQFGMVFEDLDACLIITGGEISEQRYRDVIWEFFPDAFIEDDDKAETTSVVIPAYKRLPKRPHAFTEKLIEGKTIRLSKPLIMNAAGYPVSMLPLTVVFMEADKAGNIDKVSFNFAQDEMQMTWTEGDETNTINIGMDGEYRWDEVILGGIKYHTCATAVWTSENVLEIHVRPIEAVAERILEFRFAGNKVAMKPSMNPTSATMAETLKDSVKSVVAQPQLGELISGLLPKLAGVIDSKSVGIIK